MLPIVLAVLAAMSVMFIAMGIAMTGAGGGVASRLERYASVRGIETTVTPERETGSVVIAGLNRVIEGQDVATRLATAIARADLKLRPAEFIAAAIASPFVFVAVGYVVGFAFPAFHYLITLIVFFVVGAYFPRFYLKFRQGRRLKAFANQLPDTITLLANSMRAGSSFLQGIELVTREARPPIGEEFSRVVREMSLGMALQPALENLARRVDSQDLDLMVTAISIQSQVGGNLATVLDSIAYTIRERIRIQGEIQTLTAMQRYSGYVITLLPIGLAGILFLISPTYITPMLQRPPELLGLPMGIIFFAIGAISMGMGYLLIRRIVDIKV
ncbi:MAG: secretion system protein F [Chloroflexi bacterium]|nr:MAG: secretion system protein F [Chloroflexota bacterium]